MRCILQLFASALGATLLASAQAPADVVVQTFENDKKGWKENVGDFSTIDFTDLEDQTPVFEQYADQGITFGGGVTAIEWPGFLNDGHGIWAFDLIDIKFDRPEKWWVAIDHPGAVAVTLISDADEEIIYQSEFLNLGGLGNHLGIVSDTEFDRITFATTEHMMIDDFHWGIPAPGALGLLAVAGLLGPPRRRRG